MQVVYQAAVIVMLPTAGHDAAIAKHHALQLQVIRRDLQLLRPEACQRCLCFLSFVRMREIRTTAFTDTRNTAMVVVKSLRARVCAHRLGVIHAYATQCLRA
jgi:hypothetical protein